VTLRERIAPNTLTFGIRQPVEVPLLEQMLQEAYEAVLAEARRRGRPFVRFSLSVTLYSPEEVGQFDV